MTFRDLHAPFPLFEAPIDDAKEYVGEGMCGICGADALVRFELGIGCAVMLPCPKCSVVNGLDADDREDVSCRECEEEIVFPDALEELTACYACLRAGRAALTKDTELGMISWEQAFEGATHGSPGLRHPDFEMIATESDWVRARLNPEVMFELLRTPGYSTIQGEVWQFCCRQPMVFLGTWSRDAFHENAPDGDGRSLFEKVVIEPAPGLWEDELHDETGIYMFRCGSCRSLRAHWDLA